MNLKLTNFEEPKAEESLFYTLEVTSRVRDTKASNEFIFFKRRTHISNRPVYFNIGK